MRAWRPHPTGRSLSLALLIAAATLVAAFPYGAWTAHPVGGPFSASGAAALVPATSAGSSTGAAAPGETTASTTPALCSVDQAGWNALEPGLSAPPPVGPALSGPCGVGPDEASLTFLSNATTAGTRSEFGIALPPVGDPVASVLGAFSLRTWTTGVPCSFDGATSLVAQFVPPLSPYGAAPTPNWTVRPQAFDLVPPASCDPLCANSTAFVSVDGASYCEDNILRSSQVSVDAPTASFAPGDAVSVAFVGTATGTAGLEVYVNDTSHPSADRLWSFLGATTITGQPLEPYFNASTPTSTAWGDGGAVSAAWTNCPIQGAGAACLSYNGPLLAATAPLRVTSEASWNASDLGYDLPYERVLTESSTLGCTSTVLACSSFNSGGGTGTYPYFTLQASAGAASWSYGVASASSVGDQGGSAGQFASAPGTVVPAEAIGPMTTSSTVSRLTVEVPVADAGSAVAVNVSAYYCASGSSPSVASAPATLSVGGTNSSSDGTWTASFPLSGSTGVYPVWARAESADGSWSAPAFTYPTITGGGSTCLFAAPPTPIVTSGDLEVIGGGYAVQWTESDPAVLGYTVNLTGPHLQVSEQVGAVLGARITGGLGGVPYNVTVTARDAANLSSGPSGPTVGLPVALPLSLAVNYTERGGAYAADPMVSLNLTMLGGVGPYNVSTSFGDGTPMFLDPSNGSLLLAHTYFAYQGDAQLSLVASDAVGDTATFSVGVPVDATPLGVPQRAAAGDGYVTLNWSSPYSLASPLTGFVICYSENSSLVGWLASGAYGNNTIPGVSVWSTRSDSFTIAVPDGSTLYAQVLGRNAYGIGQLPSGDPVLVGRPAPFVLSPIASVAGGPAPFSDNFSAVATGGSNDSILDAIYSFPGEISLTPSIADVNGTFYVNGSMTFDGPGTYPVVLHLVDAFYDVGIQVTTVYVSPGAGPTLSVGVVNAPSYNGSTVEFQAQASGGSGTYGYNWSFGDGGAASGVSPTHTYDAPGTYSVVVRVTDNVTDGTNVTVIPVTIYASPVVFVSATPGSDGPLSYEFRASVGGGSGRSQVVWSFGDGSVGNGFNVSHPYASPGTYEINVTATDPSGRSGTTEYYLVATASPGGGAGASGGWPSYVVVGLVIFAAAATVAALYFARARPPPPAAEPVGGYEEEDGEVTLA